MPLRRQARRQVLVGPGEAEVGPDLLPRFLQVRGKPGALLAPQNAGAERPATVGPLLPRQPVEVARVLAEAECPFLVPQGPLNLPLGERQLPHASGPRVHAVDQQVEVRVAAVAVGNDERVVLGQPQVEEELVRDADHGLARDHVLGVEAHRQVVDGFPSGGGRRHRGHDGGGVADGRRPHVPPLEPVDPPLSEAVVAVLQVRGQGGETRRVRLVADHGSATVARIRRSASVASPAAAT